MILSIAACVDGQIFLLYLTIIEPEWAVSKQPMRPKAEWAIDSEAMRARGIIVLVKSN